MNGYPTGAEQNDRIETVRHTFITLSALFSLESRNLFGSQSKIVHACNAHLNGATKESIILSELSGKRKIQFFQPATVYGGFHVEYFFGH